MFYTARVMRPEYREEPCKVALNRVKGMPFRWSLNPYMGCAHRCTFCFVRAFERLADRPSDDRYGTSIRVKTNLVEVLRRELARPRWTREQVAVGTATDPYQPAEGRWKLTRGADRRVRRVLHAVRPHHARPADRPRPRRARGGRPARGRVSHLLGADARPGDLAPDGARDRATGPAAARAPHARRPRHPRERRHGADPARPVGPAGPARGRRPRRAGCRRDRRLGEPAVPEAGHARALPRPPRPRLAGAAYRPTSGSTLAARTRTRPVVVVAEGRRRPPSRQARRRGPPDDQGRATSADVPIGALVPAPGQLTLLLPAA